MNLFPGTLVDDPGELATPLHRGNSHVLAVRLVGSVIPALTQNDQQPGKVATRMKYNNSRQVIFHRT